MTVTLIDWQGETVRLGDGKVLVASRSHPGRWYDVTHGTCQCEHYEIKHRCRHIKVDPYRPKDKNQPRCPRCQLPITVGDRVFVADIGQCSKCVETALRGV